MATPETWTYTKYAHDTIATRFTHPKRYLVYEARDPGPTLPTAEEIRQGVPHPSGAGTGMEDCALNTGLFLATVIASADQFGLDVRREEAGRLAEALLTLVNVNDDACFLCRGKLPEDEAHYPWTSMEQIFGWFYGAWRYCRSPNGDDKIRNRLSNAAVRILVAADHRDFQFSSEDGKPDPNADMKVIQPNRSLLTLGLYAMTFCICHDTFWRDSYCDLRDYRNQARLKDIGQATLPLNNLLINQLSLEALLAVEQEEAIRKTYADMMLKNARQAAPALLQRRGFTMKPAPPRYLDWRKHYAGFLAANPNYTPDISDTKFAAWLAARQPELAAERHHIRQPIEAAFIQLLCPQQEYVASQEPLIRQAIALLTYHEMLCPHGFVLAERCTQIGVQRGLFDPPG